MTLWGNRANLQAGILSDGAAITTSNSANGGTAFTNIAKTGTGNVTWDATTQTYACSDTAGAAYGYLEWSGLWNTDIGVVEVAGYGVSNLGSGDSRLIEVRSASASVCRVEIDDAAGQPKLFVYGQSGASSVANSGTNYLPTAAGWRISVGFQVSTGTLQVRLYLGSDGTSNTPTWSTTLTAQGLGAANADRVYIGQINSTATGVHKIRDVRFDNSTYAALGTWPATPPVINSPVAVVGRNYTGQITSAATPVVLSASQTAGPSVGTITISGHVAYFNAPTQGSVTIQFSLTDANTQVTTENVDFYPVSASAGTDTYVWSDTLQQWT